MLKHSVELRTTAELIILCGFVTVSVLNAHLCMHTRDTHTHSVWPPLIGGMVDIHHHGSTLDIVAVAYWRGKGNGG